MVEVGIGIDFCCGDFSNYRVLTESGAAHKVIDDFALFCSESAGTIRHQSDILCVSNGWAEVRSRVFTEGATFLFALRGVAGDDNVSNFNSSDSRTNTFNDGRGLVPNNDGPNRLSVKSIELINISMAERIGDDFDSNFSSFGRIYPDFFDDEGFFGPIGDGSLAQNRL